MREGETNEAKREGKGQIHTPRVKHALDDLAPQSSLAEDDKLEAVPRNEGDVFFHAHIEYVWCGREGCGRQLECSHKPVEEFFSQASW